MIKRLIRKNLNPSHDPFASDAIKSLVIKPLIVKKYDPYETLTKEEKEHAIRLGLKNTKEFREYQQEIDRRNSATISKTTSQQLRSSINLLKAREVARRNGGSEERAARTQAVQDHAVATGDREPLHNVNRLYSTEDLAKRNQGVGLLTMGLLGAANPISMATGLAASKGVDEIVRQNSDYKDWTDAVTDQNEFTRGIGHTTEGIPFIGNVWGLTNPGWFTGGIASKGYNLGLRVVSAVKDAYTPSFSFNPKINTFVSALDKQVSEGIRPNFNNNNLLYRVTTPSEWEAIQSPGFDITPTGMNHGVWGWRQGAPFYKPGSFVERTQLARKVKVPEGSQVQSTYITIPREESLMVRPGSGGKYGDPIPSTQVHGGTEPYYSVGGGLQGDYSSVAFKPGDVLPDFSNAEAWTKVNGKWEYLPYSPAKRIEWHAPMEASAEGRTNLQLVERPSKLTEAEKLGIPKSERSVSDPQVLKNALKFAEKYGYDIPKNVEEAKNMYRQHNTFYRGVNWELHPEDWNGNKTIQELNNMDPLTRAKILASKGYPTAQRTWDPVDEGFSDQEVFVTPSSAVGVEYANPTNINSHIIALLRPFSFRNPDTWHIDADWRPSNDMYALSKGSVVVPSHSHPTYEMKVSTQHLIPKGTFLEYPNATLLPEFLERNKPNVIHVNMNEPALNNTVEYNPFTNLFTALHNPGGRGERGFIFDEDIFNNDPEVQQLLLEFEKYSKIMQEHQDPTFVVDPYEEIPPELEQAIKLYNLNPEYHQNLFYDAWSKIDDINDILREKRKDAKYYIKAPDAPNFRGKGNEVIDFVEGHPEYVTDLWKHPEARVIGDIPSSIKTDKDMLLYLDWYKDDVFPRLQQSSKDAHSVLNKEGLDKAFNDLVVKIVDIPETDLGGWANDETVHIIANEFGLDPSTFVHELHHYLRTKLDALEVPENKFGVTRGAAGQQRPSESNMFSWAFSNSGKNGGYTRTEADLLDNAYTFLLDYIDLKNINPLKEKGATNTELRYNIAKAYATDGIPLRGKELDAKIDALTDDELFEMMHRTFSNGEKIPMNGYMKNFIKLALDQAENEDWVNSFDFSGKNGLSERATEIFYARLPQIRKALKYVGMTVPAITGVSNLNEYRLGGKLNFVKLLKTFK